jgi:hypothetical protein
LDGWIGQIRGKRKYSAWIPVAPKLRRERWSMKMLTHEINQIVPEI